MKYRNSGGVSYRVDAKNGDEMMANFTAEIVKETNYIGGVANEKTLTLVGEQVDPEGGPPKKLPEITMSDSEFAGMAWPLKYWGVSCVILPGSGIKDDLRTSIQLLSKPAKASIYRQTGWHKIDGKRAYVHRGGAVTATGNDPSVSVQLPPELRYDLTPTGDAPKDCVAATLAMMELAQPDLMWPLFAATFAPLYGPVDFAVHVTGRTGSFKSEVMSLFQSHYGAEMDARHLPGSWSSSDNALEAMAFLAQHAAFCIDDFVPHGSAWQQRTYQGKAERIFRAQGNQAGRQRLTDVSGVQQTMYPRGCVLSTGEDTPEGHSVRGRMIIREIKPGDVKPENLSAAQANRSLYPGTTLWLIQSLAKTPADLKERANAIRDELISVGHGRTPSILGQMVAVCEDILQRWKDAKFITEAQRKALDTKATTAIVAAGNEQQSFLEATDPVEVFFATLKQIWAQGGGHVRSTSGGVPRNAELMGWTKEQSADDSVPQYKARGNVMGWASAKKDELYLDPTLAVNMAKKVNAAGMPLNQQTLMKRVNEAGWLLRTDPARSRLTCRVSCDGAVRQVLVLRLSDVLDTEEAVDTEE